MGLSRFQVGFGSGLGRVQVGFGSGLGKIWVGVGFGMDSGIFLGVGSSVGWNFEHNRSNFELKRTLDIIYLSNFEL